MTSNKVYHIISPYIYIWINTLWDAILDPHIFSSAVPNNFGLMLPAESVFGLFY